MNAAFTRRSVLAALLLATATLCAQPTMVQADEGDRYAAVAYSSATKRYGYSHNCQSLERAQSRALAECGVSDARIVCWSKNGWIAIARGYNGSTSWGHAFTESAARAQALANGLRFSSYTRIVVCVPAGN